jgi:hypothetical protein
MNNEESNILESVDFISEEDLLVEELDRRLSFGTSPVINWCPARMPDTPPNCGRRG